jgi:hypothetical protein
MAIIRCDSAFNEKTNCDLCTEELKTPCWGWFGFQHVDVEIDKEGETRHLTPFDLVLCIPCSSRIAYNIISDMKNAVQDYRKAADYIESMPIMPPVPSVNVENIKNN